MSDHERGAYAPPTDAPLAFEGRQPVRGARPFPLTLVVSVLVLLGLAAAIFVFYRSGVRQAAGPPQAVGASVGGLKAPASADAQPQDAAAGLEIYRSESGQPPQMVPQQGPQFTPGPEQPAARAAGGPPVVVKPAPAGPAPTATSLPPAQPAAPALRPAQNPPPAPVAAAPALKPAPPAPAPKPAPKPTVAATIAAPPAPKPAEKAKPAPAQPPAARAGVAAVQIGAVSSPALADKTWNDAVAVAPGLAAGKGKGVEKVERDGKTLYRTAVTGFASRDAAQAFCGKLKAAGKACFVK